MSKIGNGIVRPSNSVIDSGSAEPEKKLSILVVDDDERAAKALSRILANAGFQTTVFHNGSDAIRHAAVHSFSAALIDIHLPDLNGLVLSQKLREQLGPDVPIFVVSGDTSMATLNSLRHVGATHFFAKPMAPAMILKRLEEELRR